MMKRSSSRPNPGCRVIITLLLCITIALPLSFGAAAATEVIDEGPCGENLTWTLFSDGLLEISGTGPMWDYHFFEDESCSDAPWNAHASKLKALKLNEGLTTIGQYAFCVCRGFTGSLTIPDSVKVIGNYAFSGCSGFSGSLVMSNGVTTIGFAAFSGCSFTGCLSIPASVSTIAGEAFYNCSGFRGHLSISDGVSAIGYQAFYNCAGITEADFYGNAPAAFGSNVFTGCAGGFQICYLEGKNGWTKPTWNGYPCSPKDLNAVKYGDANNDGIINLLDVIHLRQYIHPSYTVVIPDLRAADADGDGKINILDVVRLRQYIHPSYTVTLGPQNGGTSGSGNGNQSGTGGDILLPEMP